MTDTKKIEKTGTFRRGFQRGGTRPIKSFQSHKSKIEELEDATFNCGHRDNAARYESAVEDITAFVVRTYRGGVHVGTAIRTGAIPNLLKSGIGSRKPKYVAPSAAKMNKDGVEIESKPVI